MRSLDARLTMATVSAWVVLCACSGRHGLSAPGDGAAGSTGGATAATGGVPGTGGLAATGGSSAVGGTKTGLGGAIPSGGVTASGGAISSGGTTTTGGASSGGSAGGGGTAGGSGGAGVDAGTTKDAGRDHVCPPLCDLYCPYGNERDGNGCELCKCKPAPVDAGTSNDLGPSSCHTPCLIFCPNGNVVDSNGCPTCECNPEPIVCPAIRCQPCPFGQLKDEKGCDTCACAPDPGMPCADIIVQSTCAATGSRCRWLVPGCDEPALPAAGCYDTTLLDCSTSCPSGRSCLQRSIDPCHDRDCAACSMTMSICL